MGFLHFFPTNEAKDPEFPNMLMWNLKNVSKDISTNETGLLFTRADGSPVADPRPSNRWN